MQFVKSPKGGNSSFYNDSTMAYSATTDYGDSGGPVVLVSGRGRLQFGVHSQGPKRQGADIAGTGVAAKLHDPQVHDWLNQFP